ncbi:MAG TPA: serine/threonine-protein kinase [Candidatus Angelobacter sp.]|nr:serine/threonine-protein kinase [Candidatus Angelobacter sp.]
MSRSDWSEVERVLATVIDLPKAERQSRVMDLCAGNQGLRAEVESLLAAHESADSFLEPRPLVTSKPTSGFSLAGKQLGPYQLLEAIGEGGMGTVYSAERTDGRFQKRVAIKVALGAVHSPELLRRFSGEQQILATLEHPNIARLLDAGVSPEGIPYLVMEYVEGTPLNEYCRAQRIPTRKRLVLFQAICSAVSYAHQHLVVHRDIKPGNILVTSDGIPKLLDFGIAKIVDEWRGAEAEVTRSILNPMTPDYASPEQACGGTITTATDIYSLGVVLYELVTEQRPYEVAGKPLHEAMRIISEKEPQKPSAVMRDKQKQSSSADRSVAGFSVDLDAIVAKAMRKDPQQRYASSHELANDLGRYLSGLPVSAHRGTLRYVATKFISRHKIAVLASAVALILAVAGVAAVVWQARIARRQKETAQRRFEQVRSLAKSLMFEVHDSIKDLPGATPARKLIVERALEYLDGLSQEAGGDASLQRELAAAYERVGDVQGYPYVANLGDPVGAAASYRKSLVIQESLLQTDPGNAALKRELSGTYWKAGICLDASSNFQGALENLRRAQSLAQELGAAKGDSAARDWLAGDYWAIGHVLQERHDFTEALESYRRASALRESVAATDSARAKAIRTHLAADYYGTAEVLHSQGQHEAAAEAASKSLAILQALAKEDPENATLRGYLASSYTTLGIGLESQSLLNQALENYRQAQKIYQMAATADPKDALSYRLTGYIEMQIGRTLAKKGNLRGGLESLHHALSVFQDLAKRAPASNYVLYNFGNVYSEIAAVHVALASDSRRSTGQQAEQWKEARSWYEKSLDVWREVRSQGKLGGDEIGEPERLPGEIAKCDKAIARLKKLAARKKPS